MKKVIRNNVFETNSSSSHSISIIKKPQMFKDFPKKIYFELHEFNNFPEHGDDMKTLEGRANYLYSAAVNHWMEDKLVEYIKAVLGYSIELEFEEFNEENDWSRYLINHQAHDESYDLLVWVMDNPAYLINYLFDDKTEIEITGDWAIEGVTGGEDRIVFGYTKEEMKGWENEL